MNRHHSHTCRCGTKFNCSAPLVQNFDGWPDPVCILVMEIGPQICDGCEQRIQDDLDAQDAEEAVH